MKDLVLIIISILWCIPILVSFVISSLRKKLESDRNFYGEEISPKDIELVKVRYKPFDVKASDFSECNKDGELQYFYKKERVKMLYMLYQNRNTIDIFRING